MTWVWRRRSPLYLLGVAGLVVATLGYAVAHVAPFWVKQEAEQAQNRSLVNIGLWFLCLDDGSCVSHSFTFDEDSVKATLILQVLGLVILVTSVATAIFVNCRRQHPGPSFFLEAVAALGSVLGFSGSIVYLAATLEDVEDSGLTHYDWAFALSIAASLQALLSAILIFSANIRSVLRDQGSGGSSLQDATGLVKSHDKPPASDAGAVRSDNDPYSREVYPPGAPGEPPSFVEPPMDYHHDPAVYSMREPASLPPMTDPPFPPEHGRHGGARSDWYPGKGWRKMIKLPPPPSRRPYDEYGHMAVGMQPVGAAARHGRHPLGMGPPAGTFVLPRVIVRGYFEPGYGYPEYTMF